MRAVAAAVLASVRIAAADDLAVDAPVLEAARKAGYPRPRVIDRGTVSLVVQNGTADKDGEFMAIGPAGTPLRELAPVSGKEFSVVSASQSAFFGRKELVDVLVVVGGGPFSPPAATHFILRAASLEPACQFAGPSDTLSLLKGQRFITTVAVTKLPGKAFAFEVATKSVRRDNGRVITTHASVVKYALDDAGPCTELAK